jgi:hypothetical protein
MVRDNGLLKGDSEKFQKILQQYESRKRKLTDSIAIERNELQRERMSSSPSFFELILMSCQLFVLNN